MTSPVLAASFARRYRRAAVLLLCILLGMSGFASAGAKAATHTVVIDGVQFAPATVYAKVGDTVIWENKDPFPHTATSVLRQFDSGNIRSGRSWRFRVKSKGTFDYICTLHPNMKASLIVK